MELDKLKNKSNDQHKVPAWILNAQTKRTKGLRFNYKKKKDKQNKYVELPSSKVCLFYGNTGHLKDQCSKRNSSLDLNGRLVEQMWVKEPNSVVSTEEPENARVPAPNI